MADSAAGGLLRFTVCNSQVAVECRVWTTEFRLLLHYRWPGIDFLDDFYEPQEVRLLCVSESSVLSTALQLLNYKQFQEMVNSLRLSAQELSSFAFR